MSNNQASASQESTWDNWVPLASIGKKGPSARRPPWMRTPIRSNPKVRNLRKLLRQNNLHTVCEEARCPNLWECWGEHQTATFMILGDICTRACRYCSVKSGRPTMPDANEPKAVAKAAKALNLRHCVITSVDRDDLADFGAGHFVATLHAVKQALPDCAIEILVPDFGGDAQAFERVLKAGPAVLNHNTETVPRLYPRMRAKGDYRRCLNLLAQADAYRRHTDQAMTTKTGIMCGLGENKEELLKVMDDLRQVNCDVLTLGQYLNPTQRHAPIARFYHPDEFLALREEGLSRGFAHVEAGPNVRSSYHAHNHVPQNA